MTIQEPAPDDFDTWLASRPKWLQTAAAQLLADGRPDAGSLQCLADLCLGEAKKTPGLAIETMPVGAFAIPATPLNLRINKIAEVTGLNAIRAGAELNFEEGNLTIIFGTNGVGKSGFARLLKHACGARKKGDLHPNVFAPGSPIPTAKFQLDRDGKVELHTWTLGDAPLKPLKYVHVFDSATAAEYVNTKNEASYETRRLRFISALIEICDQVSAILTERQSRLVIKLPALPLELAQSPAASFLHSLSARSTQAMIDAACTFTPEKLEQRLALEIALAETNIDGKLFEIRQRTNQLTLIEKSLYTLTKGFSEENLALLVAAQRDYNTKRQAATDAAQQTFANTPLKGIGEDSWRLMWEQARRYSQLEAYKLQPYPVVTEDAHCVLCQQPLSEDAKIRLSSFENFVQGALEVQANQTQEAYTTLLGAFPKMPEPEAWRSLLLPLKLNDAEVDASYAKLSAIHQQLNILLPEAPLHGLHLTDIGKALALAKLEASQQEQALLDSQDQQKRAVMIQQLIELKAREWLSQQKNHIEDEVARLAAVATLQDGIKTTKTTQLTAKKNELMESDLAQGYQVRFSEELKLLGGRSIPVEPTPIREGKGKVSFQLSLKGATRKERTQDILSEGENRIVSLAAFLADMRGLGFPTPFVFDDPISSLDQDFEERVVARLVELAKDRQVIVFTHRLSLVTLLQTKLESEGFPAPRIESLLRIGKQAGIVDTLRIRHSKPANGFSVLRQSLKEIETLEDAGDPSCEFRLNSACTDFRILLEKAIEVHLLDEVVVRFRRSLETKGRIGKLLLNNADDIKLINDMMTKYSVFEHSQPDDLPASPIPLEELKEDIDIMSAWISDIKKRKK